MRHQQGRLSVHRAAFAALGFLAFSGLFNSAAADGPETDLSTSAVTTVMATNASSTISSDAKLTPAMEVPYTAADAPLTITAAVKPEFLVSPHPRKESAFARDFAAAKKCAAPIMKAKNLTMDSVLAEFDGQKITVENAFKDWMINCMPPVEHFDQWVSCLEEYGFARMPGDYSFAEAKYRLPGNDDVNKIAHKESRFYPCAVSRAKAMGMTQFMNFTAKSEGLTNPFNPIAAVFATAQHLQGLYEIFPGRPGFAHGAYNWGPKNMLNHQKKFGLAGCWRALNSETRGYTAGMIGNEGCKIAKKKSKRRHYAKSKGRRLANTMH